MENHIKPYKNFLKTTNKKGKIHQRILERMPKKLI